jgi:hypothetical protein
LTALEHRLNVSAIEVEIRKIARFGVDASRGRILHPVSPRTKVVIVRIADSDGIDPPQWREVFQYIAEHVDESYRQDHRERD